MSLTDAFLLEPYPFEIWISARTDGIKGSGTASDPYDGGPVLATAKSITLSRVGTLATALISNTSGLSNGSTVLISGATGADGAFYNGYFTIQNVVTNTSFDYVMNGIPSASASGTIMSALVTGTKLDALS